MPTVVSIQNNMSSSVAVGSTVAPSLSGSDWGIYASSASAGQQTQMLWMDRDEGITNGKTWIFTSALTLGGVTVKLEESVTGTLVASDIQIQIVAGDQSTGWSSNDPVSVVFTGTDGNVYRIVGTYVSGSGDFDNVLYTISASAGGIMPQIEHVVVLMMENRSLDNLLGWAYGKGQPTPSQFIPAGSPQVFNGLNTGSYSNSDPGVNGGQPVSATNGTTTWEVDNETVAATCVPNPDPGEEFAHVTTQIFNGGTTGNMSGFLTDYVPQVQGAGGPVSSAAMIMQSYSPDQLPVITNLAQAFAVSDAWYSSVPSQTWPNRGFLLTGSSDGNVNNNYHAWSINNIFDVLTAENIDWMVYNDGVLPSLVKTMFLGKYWDNETNFGSISDFQAACQQAAEAPNSAKLPPFTFLEPSFGPAETDESYHPPYDVRPAEQFLATIYSAISSSPYSDRILFVLLFDEHGGTYDHVVPPGGAEPPSPYPVATDGSGFTFDRFGVRVPAIVVSPYVTPGTVFRSSTSVPFDHTSILATLRDWLGLGSTFTSMLPSPRIANAPTLAPVLSSTVQQSWPSLPAPSEAELAEIAAIPLPPDDQPLNDLQRLVLVAAAGIVAGRPYTRAEAVLAHQRLRTHGDARVWLAALQPHLPIR